MPLRQRRLHLGVDHARRPRAWYCAALGVPDHDVGAAELGEHRAGDVAGVGAGRRAARGPARRSRSAACRRRPAVCTLRMSVNGGRTATSTRSSSFSVRLKASFCTSAMASRWLRFIFQLPAISGRRAARLPSATSRSPALRRPGSGLALQVLQRRAAAGARCGRTPSSARPSARTAAAESPPPTTVKPSTVGDRLGHAAGARRERAPARTRPSGRSRTPFSAPASAVGERAHRAPGRCPGPAGRPGSRRRPRPSCSASAANASATTTSVGSTILSPASAQQVAGRCRPGPSSSSELPTSWPCAARKVKHMPPPIEQPVDLGQQRLDHGELVARPSSRRARPRTGRSRVAGQPAQHLDLAQHQAAGVVRQQRRRRRRRRRACGARRRTRRRRSASAEARPARRRTRRARPSSLLVSPASKRMFSSSSDARRRRGRRPRRGPASPTVSAANGDRRAEQLAQPRARPARGSTSGPGAPLGRPRCDGDDHPGAGVAQRRQGRQDRPDPAVVGDHARRRRLSSGTFRSARTSTRRPADALGEQVVERSAPVTASAPTSVTRSTRRLE